MTVSTIELDVTNTEEIPEELYEYIIDQLLAKANAMGFDIVERDDIVIGNFVITAPIEKVNPKG